MIGSGEPFLISIIAWAASLVGTATRTMRQLASFRRAISLSVALTSLVSAFVIDCTTISAAPPTTTSPMRTGTDLRRVLMASSQHIVICHKSDQAKQESEADVVNDLLSSGIDRPPPNQLEHQKSGAAAVQRRERQDVGQPQAEAEEGDYADQRQRPRLRRPRRGLGDTHRTFQTPRTQQTTQFLVGGQLVDAADDPDNGIACVPDRPPRRVDRTRLPGPDPRVEAQYVVAGGRVKLGGCRQCQQLTMTLDHQRNRGVFGGIQRVSKVVERLDG